MQTMNFPPEWNEKGKESRSQSSKRQKTSRAPKGSHAAQQAEQESQGRPSLLSQIQNKLNAPGPNKPTERIQIDNVINTIPYKDIISNVFENSQNLTVHVPIVTRAYEESFMRECEEGQERACVNGDMCECMFIDHGNQFVGVEFLLPHEPPGETPKPCVLCQRQMTQKLYFDIMYDGKNFNIPIQKYGNIFNQSGEYAREVMLSCPANGPLHCMPYPIVAHQRNRYTVHSQHGFRSLKQHNVFPEDYQQVSRRSTNASLPCR